jgi:23S rRNA pseudouridine2605 synthase
VRDGVWLRFIVHEGRNRQVRRMCAAVGLEPRRLVRTRLGPIHLGELPSGRYRPLRPEETAALRRAATPG